MYSLLVKYLFFLLLLHSFIDVCFTVLNCKNDHGQSVDWLIVYKLPQIHNSNSHNSFITSGEGYAYLAADEVNQTNKWILSSHSITSNKSAVARILGSITESKNVAYLIYNDELPGKQYTGTKWGHTKGVLAFDDKSGYWLIHSVPKFPDIGHYKFPNGSKEHGQIFICVTFNFSDIDKIGNQFLYMKPQIYKRQSNHMVLKLSQAVQSLFTNNPSFIRKPPWYHIESLTSKGGIPFVSFSKHSRFHEDLYSTLVAPKLHSSLYTETWLRGSGTPLLSNCTIRYPVWNVKSINISLYYNMKMEDVGFHSSSDHSKWAVSATHEKQWTCIGDINRMKSQEKRGGGTLCFSSRTVWKNFHSAVSAFESCQYDI